MSAIQRSTLLVLLWAAFVAADDGDDLTNNLFTDLAPLLALFGERVTMQFMSESMGWSDNIILAMAPLGIITAIIGAIRVGGSSWLKAIIGRARENLVVAEAELMSSTSDELCELWNGRDVVRCMGSGAVTEFICVMPKTTSKEGGKMTKFEMMKLEKAEETRSPYLQKRDMTLCGDWARWRCPPALKTDAERNSTDSSLPDMVITRNTRRASPNISLNSHNRSRRGELRFVAVIGVIVQLVVLIFSGFATYYPTMKYPKGNSPVARYAYPCFAVGTGLLVIGMLLCAHVVESSTGEERYEPGPGQMTRLVWLQRAQPVSDQIFESFLVYPESPPDVITTSSRLRKDATDQAESDRQPTTRLLEIKSLLGASIALVGYVVQFTGLRALQWYTSIVQLGAVGVMVCLRAWVRRGLTQSPGVIKLKPGFELESLAAMLGEPDKAPWLQPGKSDTTSESQTSKYPQTSKPHTTVEPYNIPTWVALTGRCSETYRKLQPPPKDVDTGKLAAKSTDAVKREMEPPVAHRVMMARRDLARLASWSGPASAEAISLAKAIDITMNLLLDQSQEKQLIWTLPVQFNQTGNERVRFQLTRKENDATWQTDPSEIEAALSLWLHSGETGEDEPTKSEHKSPANRETGNSKTDAWFHTQESVARRNLRLLGPSNEALQRDLRWWMPPDTSDIMEIEEAEAVEDGDVKLDMPHHRIVGCGHLPEDVFPSGDSTQYRILQTSIAEADVDSNPTDANSDQRQAKTCLLAREVYMPLKQLYAQDIFTSFMWTAAKSMTHPVEGAANIRPTESSRTDSWRFFTLRNDRLVRLAREVQQTGLGNLEEIYLSIIPPLSVSERLPPADAIVELARQQAKPYELVQN